MVDYWEYHTLTDTIIAALTSGRSTREFHRILRERGKARYKRASIDATLSRLKKKNYISKNGEVWSLTKSGKTYFEKKNIFDFIDSPFEKGAARTCIVSFDISTKDRAKRDWLRGQLKMFDYVMIQQSLWQGPGPLPKEFLIRLGKLKINEQVKIFTIQK